MLAEAPTSDPIRFVEDAHLPGHRAVCSWVLHHWRGCLEQEEVDSVVKSSTYVAEYDLDVPERSYVWGAQSTWHRRDLAQVDEWSLSWKQCQGSLGWSHFCYSFCCGSCKVNSSKQGGFEWNRSFHQGQQRQEHPAAPGLPWLHPEVSNSVLWMWLIRMGPKKMWVPWHLQSHFPGPSVWVVPCFGLQFWRSTCLPCYDPCSDLHWCIVSGSGGLSYNRIHQAEEGDIYPWYFRERRHRQEELVSLGDLWQGCQILVEGGFQRWGSRWLVFQHGFSYLADHMSCSLSLGGMCWADDTAKIWCNFWSRNRQPSVHSIWGLDWWWDYLCISSSQALVAMWGTRWEQVFAVHSSHRSPLCFSETCIIIRSESFLELDVGGGFEDRDQQGLQINPQKRVHFTDIRHGSQGGAIPSITAKHLPQKPFPGWWWEAFRSEERIIITIRINRSSNYKCECFRSGASGQLVMALLLSLLSIPFIQCKEFRSSKTKPSMF